MKKLIFLFLVLLSISCGPDSSEDNSSNNSFSINLTPSTTNVVVDEASTITVSATEEIKELWISTDNFATGVCSKTVWN